MRLIQSPAARDVAATERALLRMAMVMVEDAAEARELVATTLTSAGGARLSEAQLEAEPDLVRVVSGRAASANGTVVEQLAVTVQGAVLEAEASGRVMAVVPARGVVVGLTVEEGGADRVAIALASIDARRFVVREDAGGVVREVWVDREGRVLKVAIPAMRIVAVRDEAPRSVTR